MIPTRYQAILYVNPVAPLILSWRRLFLTGHLEWSALATAHIYAMFALGAGFLIYLKLSWKFAEVI
jgi:lipopolysaccharide transport system permease protein